MTTELPKKMLYFYPDTELTLSVCVSVTRLAPDPHKCEYTFAPRKGMSLPRITRASLTELKEKLEAAGAMLPEGFGETAPLQLDPLIELTARSVRVSLKSNSWSRVKTVTFSGEMRHPNKFTEILMNAQRVAEYHRLMNDPSGAAKDKADLRQTKKDLQNLQKKHDKLVEKNGKLAEKNDALKKENDVLMRELPDSLDILATDSPTVAAKLVTAKKLLQAERVAHGRVRTNFEQLQMTGTGPALQETQAELANTKNKLYQTRSELKRLRARCAEEHKLLKGLMEQLEGDDGQKLEKLHRFLRAQDRVDGIPSFLSS